jgi:hypothetical protein
MARENTLKSITVKLDLTKLDDEVSLADILGVSVRYKNFGEGDEWEDLVVYDVVSMEPTEA